MKRDNDSTHPDGAGYKSAEELTDEVRDDDDEPEFETIRGPSVPKARELQEMVRDLYDE